MKKKKYTLKKQASAVSTPLQTSLPLTPSQQDEAQQQSYQVEDLHAKLDVLMGSCANCMPVASYTTYQLTENFTNQE